MTNQERNLAVEDETRAEKRINTDDDLLIRMENNQTDFKVYGLRWGVLLTVALLNISNASIWINMSPVAVTAANYFELEKTEAINWFSLIFLIIAIPGAFYGTFCVDKLGLKIVIWMGCSFNFLGACIRAVATSNLFSDLHTQFVVSLVGQVFAAIGQNFILYLHTKVSQTWFSDDQRGVSTTILSMSNPMGVVIAEVTVPYIVTSAEDIPRNDKIWLGVSVLTAVSTIVFVRRAKPKTFPSHSAFNVTEDRPPYLQQLKIAFTTVPFLLLLLSLGGGVAFTIAIATVTQQIICPLGYSEAFGGMVNGLMLLFGFVGSAFAGILLDKTKMYTEITIYLFGIAALCGIALFEFLLVPHQQVAIIIFASLFGLFGVSLFPVGLELAVETTYPVEESITTAFIFLSGQLQGIAIIAMVPALARDKVDDTYLSVCDTDTDEVPKDYTVSILAVMVLLGFISCVSIAFFKTEYKRQNATIRSIEASNLANNTKAITHD